MDNLSIRLQLQGSLGKVLELADILVPGALDKVRALLSRRILESGLVTSQVTPAALHASLTTRYLETSFVVSEEGVWFLLQPSSSSRTQGLQAVLTRVPTRMDSLLGYELLRREGLLRNPAGH